MPYTGWLRHGTVDAIDDARAQSHADYHCLTGVRVDGAHALGAYLGGTYPGPVGPADPWWSPDPAAPGFLGIIGMTATGLEASPRSREVTAGSGPGGTPRAPVVAPREIAVEVVLLATGRAGLNYGLAWLAGVLEQRDAAGYSAAAEAQRIATASLPPRWGPAPRPGALAAPLRFLAVPPDDPGGPPVPLTLFDVVLTDGPDVTAVHHLPASATAAAPVAAEVTFTLTAASPWLWGPAAQVGYTTLAAWPHAYGTAGNPWAAASTLPVRWVMSRNLTAPLTPRGSDPEDPACAAGSGCPPPATLPRPALDLDWCAATMPLVPRWGGLPDWKDAGLLPGVAYAPILVIEPGTGPMRRASIRIGRRLPGGYHDPTGLLLRNEINVPYLPAGSRAILDARTGTAIVDCAPTGTAAGALEAGPPERQYTPAVYGIRAAPVTWPVLTGGEDLRITAHAEDDYCAPGARVTLFAAPRQALA